MSNNPEKLMPIIRKVTIKGSASFAILMAAPDHRDVYGFMAFI
jgi:hypothetical protein